MTAETRSPVELAAMSDPADGEAVLTRALLRDALHVARADVHARPEHPAKLGKQRLLGGGGEIRGAYHVHHDLPGRWLHDLHLLQARNRGQRALDQRDARNEGAVAALQIVGYPS